MVELMVVKLFCVFSANFLTSSATTANPRPCSPARAASMAAFKANKLVWAAISSIMVKTSLMLLVLLEVSSRRWENSTFCSALLLRRTFKAFICPCTSFKYSSVWFNCFSFSPASLTRAKTLEMFSLLRPTASSTTTIAWLARPCTLSVASLSVEATSTRLALKSLNWRITPCMCSIKTLILRVIWAISSLVCLSWRPRYLRRLVKSRLPVVRSALKRWSLPKGRIK